MYYKVGGSLKYNHPSYVERKADRELLELLQVGEYCLVLNSRQMGKSSLRVRTARKLRQLGIKSAFIDLTILGSSHDEDTRIKGFASQLLSSLDLETEIDLQQYWQEYQYLTSLQKLDKLIESIILAKIKQKIVIFIDEIDSLLKVPQKDNFFAFIRACYNKRVDNELYDRLCFCLLGVVSPSNLIQDKKGTPFNIGRSIELTGLTLAAAKDALTTGLAEVVDNPEKTLKDILYWTGGQPFLTQKLCTLTVDNTTNRKANITEIVNEHIITGWENQDVPEHLRTIRDRLIDDESKTIQLLGLYQRILQGEIIVADQSEEQIQLRLSGLIVKRDNQLQVYNPIYQTIFNLDWIQEKLDNLRPYSEAINSWLKTQKNPKYLLQGNDLTKAWEWSQSRKLGNIDYKFLTACQKHQTDRERKAKDILAQAHRQAEQNIQKGKIILGITIFLTSIIALTLTWYSRKQIQIAERAELNTIATEAQQAFNSGEELKSLAMAIKAVKQLHEQVGNRNIEQYPTKKPIETLNYIINNIKEKNQIKISTSSISALAFTPDNQTIIIGDKTGNVKLWNGQNNKIQALNKLPSKITKILFTTDGDILISHRGGSIQSWDIKGNVISILKAKNVSTFALSSDGQTIVAGDEAGNLSLWSKDGEPIKTPWKAHQGNITSIAFSSDSKTIASASDDTAIALWTKEGKKITTLTGHKNTVNSLTFHPSKNNQILASASSDGTIKLWSIESQLKLIQDLLNYQTKVESIAFSPDGHTLISGGRDRTIKLWNISNSSLENGKLQDNWQETNIVTNVIFSPEGNTIASGDEQGWLTLRKNPVKNIQGIETAILSPDRQTILFSKPPAGITIQKLDGTIIDTLPVIPNKIINNIAINPDRTQVIASTVDGAIAHINLKNNQDRRWNFVREENQQQADIAYQGSVIDLKFHPDGNSFIAVGFDGKSSVIKQWNNQIKLLSNIINLKSDNSATAVNYSPQGDRLILARENGEIELWKSDGSFIQKIIKKNNKSNNLKKEIANLSFHPNGKSFAIAYSDGTIQLQQIDGNLLLSFNSQKEKINNSIVGNIAEQIKYIDFSLDGKTILGIDPNGIVSTWDIDLDVLLSRGCQWGRDYFLTTDDIQDIGSIEPK